MRRSTERILTTHTGSLPRPEDLVEPLYELVEAGREPDGALQQRVREATAEVVRKQIGAGVDVVNDGEVGKVSYSTYVTTRLTGYESRTHLPRRPRNDAADFPDYAAWAVKSSGSFRIQRYGCS